MRVVAPMRASAPSFAELGPAGANAQLVNASLRESPEARRAGGEPVVARVFPTASRRGDAPAALIGLLGGASRRCADTGACEVSLTRVAATAADARMLVVTLLPDGAPLALVER